MDVIEITNGLGFPEGPVVLDDGSILVVEIAKGFLTDRLRIGTYVLLFLVVFFIFAWLLNREYWKDVH